jgi:hypothetical protein
MKMKRLGSQAILMKEKRFGYFPQVFVWHGRAHRVVECKETRTVSRGGLFGRVERRYFRVRCADGTCELYQDLLNNTWHIQNSMWGVWHSAVCASPWEGEPYEARAALV